MSFFEALWRRVSATTPVPDTNALLVIAFVALACVLLAWPTVRIVVTVCHEAGHAVAATLTGRSLKGIRLHSDTSGLTLTRGKPAGVGMVVTLLAGYPAPSLVGLFAGFVAGTGHAVAMLWLLVGLLALMLLKIRNLHGALVVSVLGGALGLATWYVPGHMLAWLAHGLAWLLLLAGPRAVLELGLTPRRVSTTSDAAQLARLTRLPRIFWTSLWLGGAIAALAFGTFLMVPGVLPIPR